MPKRPIECHPSCKAYLLIASLYAGSAMNVVVTPFEKKGDILERAADMAAARQARSVDPAFR